MVSAVSISITNDSDLFIRQPSCLGVDSAGDVPIHQFQNLPTHVSYGTPEGASSFGYSSTAWTLCSPEKKKREEKKNAVSKIGVVKKLYSLVL